MGAVLTPTKLPSICLDVLRNFNSFLAALISSRHFHRKDCAIATLRFWQMLGFASCYLVFHYTCSIRFILYGLMGTISIATITLVTSEVRLRLRQQEVRGCNVGSQFTLQEPEGATWIPKLNPLQQRHRAALIQFPTQH